MNREARIRAAVEATHKKLLQLLTSSSWSMPPEKVHVILRDAFRDLLTEAETVPCPECSDEDRHVSALCPTCHGTGRIRRELAELHKFLEWTKTKRNAKGHMDRWNGAAGPVLEYIREKWGER